jgi:hypothetical protein
MTGVGLEISTEARDNVDAVFATVVCAPTVNCRRNLNARLDSPVRGDLPTKTRYPLCCCASNREPLSSSMLIPRKAFGALAFALCIAGLFIFLDSIVQWSMYLFGSHAPLVPYTTHVVLFQFKETATSFAVKEVRPSWDAPERVHGQ